MSIVFEPIKPMDRMELDWTGSVGAAPEVVAGDNGVSIPFQSVLEDAISGLEEAQAVTQQDSLRLVMGEMDVDDLAQMQINSQKAEALLQTTVQLTTRMVNAYKEVMQMQI